MLHHLRLRSRSLSLTSATFAVSAISASLLLVFACSSSDSPAVPAAPVDGGGGIEAGGPAGDSGEPLDSGGQVDTGAPVDGATADASDAGDAASDGGVVLTVQNYLSWCTVAVNGGGSSTAATQTLTVQPGTVVNVSGDLSSATFVWGYWAGTAGDTDHRPRHGQDDHRDGQRQQDDPGLLPIRRGAEHALPAADVIFMLQLQA